MTTLKSVAAAGLAAAALLAAPLAGAQPYFRYSSGYVVTNPQQATRIYVYEYEPVNPRAMTPYDRALSAYEADRYFGHPRYPDSYYVWEGRWDPWHNRNLASSRDSNPTDHATGIYNPRQ